MLLRQPGPQLQLFLKFRNHCLVGELSLYQRSIMFLWTSKAPFSSPVPVGVFIL